MQDALNEQVSSPVVMTAGNLLQQARLAAGVHIAALAAALKVPVYKLEALEADRLDRFPDAVFVRALASSICRTLKVDAGPVLALLPQGASPRLPADRGINAAFKDGATKKSRGLATGVGSSNSRWVPIVVVVLLLAAVALIFMPRGMSFWTMHSVSGDDAKASAAEAHLPAPLVEAPSTATHVPAPDMSAVVASDAAPTLNAAPSLPSGAVTAERQVTPAPSPVSVPNTPSQSTAPLMVRARGETWVQIRSLSDGSSAQRVLLAGESLAGPGSPPWAVVIGKAAVTDVLVRGEAFDLSTVARENVARFEVK